VLNVGPIKSGMPSGWLYQRFLRAHRAVKDKRVRLVFHGTPGANIAAIIRDGLDPARRAGQALGKGEYFADDPAVAMPYCKGDNTLLLFAVLMDHSGITTDTRKPKNLKTGNPGTPGVVVCHKAEHQCPLFAVTFHAQAGWCRSSPGLLPVLCFQRLKLNYDDEPLSNYAFNVGLPARFLLSALETQL